MLSRTSINFTIDLLIAACFVGLIATGTVVHYVLPAGSGHSHALWSLGRHDWGDMHFWLAVTAIALALLHVALHWQWVCVTTCRLARAGHGAPSAPDRAKRMSAAFIAIVVLTASLAGFGWIGRSSVRPVSAGNAQSLPDQHNVSLRGSMTLADASTVTQLPVAQMRQILGLRADASPEARLGQLSREAGLTMAQARAKLMEAAEQR